jgi:hypothetical protein
MPAVHDNLITMSPSRRVPAPWECSWNSDVACYGAGVRRSIHPLAFAPQWADLSTQVGTACGDDAEATVPVLHRPKAASVMATGGPLVATDDHVQASWVKMGGRPMAAVKRPTA